MEMVTVLEDCIMRGERDMGKIVMRPCPTCGAEMEVSTRKKGRGDEILIRYACPRCEGSTAEAFAVEFLVDNDEAFQKRWKVGKRLN